MKFGCTVGLHVPEVWTETLYFHEEDLKGIMEGILLAPDCKEFEEVRINEGPMPNGHPHLMRLPWWQGKECCRNVVVVHTYCCKHCREPLAAKKARERMS